MESGLAKRHGNVTPPASGDSRLGSTLRRRLRIRLRRRRRRCRRSQRAAGRWEPGGRGQAGRAAVQHAPGPGRAGRRAGRRRRGGGTDVWGVDQPQVAGSVQVGIVGKNS